MGRERGEERRPGHDHRGRRHQPLVPQRPDLPGRHHLPHPDGKRRAQRGGPRPLRRTGKGGASRAVDLHRHGPGLGEAFPPAEHPELLVHPFRPVEIRPELRRLLQAGNRGKHAAPRPGHDRQGGPPRLASFYPPLQRQHPAAGGRGESRGGPDGRRDPRLARVPPGKRRGGGRPPGPGRGGGPPPRTAPATLYSDIVLPAATWYEKSDLNTTDMHSFVNCLDAAVPPSWESKPDWKIFGEIARKVSELSVKHFPAPVKDIVAAPLLHDTPGEIAQRSVKDWKLGECEPIPGKTMPNLATVGRDYVNLYDRFLSVGPAMGHLGAHGVNWEAGDVHEKLLETMPTRSWNGKTYIDLEDEKVVADVILAFAPETNGELAYRSYRNLEKRVGKPLSQIAAGNPSLRGPGE